MMESYCHIKFSVDKNNRQRFIKQHSSTFVYMTFSISYGVLTQDRCNVLRDFFLNLFILLLNEMRATEHYTMNSFIGIPFHSLFSLKP